VEDVSKRARGRASLPPIAVVIAIVAAPLRPAESAPETPVVALRTSASPALENTPIWKVAPWPSP
jgi:hypothetical protein